MIRGRNHFSLAVRRQDGTIEHHSEVLNSLYTGRMRQFPLIRGFIALVETMVLGIKALHLSANMAVKDQAGEEGGEIPSWLLGATLAAAMVMGIGVFFMLPLSRSTLLIGLLELIEAYQTTAVLVNRFESLSILLQ